MTPESAGEASDGALNNGRTALERRFRGAEDDDALGAERTLTDRNAARRRAFGVLEDGERTLAAVELLAANGGGRPRTPRALSREEEERLFEAQLAIEEAAAVTGAPSVLREVREMLAEQDAEAQEALIQEIAAKIPGGTESVADFRREQREREERDERQRERDARRREMVADPDGRAALDAEDALIAETRRRLQDVVPEFAPQARGNRRPGLSEAEQALFDATLIDDVAAANPATGVRFDLIDQMDEMFAAVTTAPFETSPSTMRAFSDEGLNGRTAEGRFFEIGVELGFSERQILQLLAGTPVSEVGPPAGRFTGPDRAGVNGALALLQVREPEQGIGALGEARNRFLRGARDLIESEFDEHGERQIDQANFHVGNAERAIEFTVDELTRLAEDAGDAGRRFLGELEEIKDLDNVEAFERLNQALLGGFTPQFEFSPEGVLQAIVDPRSLVFDWDRALDGLAGNVTYSGSDHLLLQRLPERYREPLGDLLEDALLAAAVGTTLAGLAISSPLSAPVTAGLVAGIIVTHGIGVIATDLSEEDSDVLELLQAVWEDARRLIEHSGLSEIELRDIEARVLELL